jgi:sugar (pentulose or hexulose) kinase
VTGALLVGLDVGTSSIKSLVIDTDGRELAHGRVATPWRTVPTGAEIDPHDLLRAASDSAADALAGRAERVVGIGVASMAETGVLVDSTGRPVVPGIAWHDARGEDEARQLADELGEVFPARVGLPGSASCTLVKYRWMRNHWPDSARGVRWFNVAEWVVRGFGGDPPAELSLASRTGFYDLHARRPWAAALAWAGAPPGMMPEAVSAGTPMGHAGGTFARGAVLTVGGHDHLAAAVGAGAANEGDVLDSCGTAEAFVRTTAPLPPDRVAQAVAAGMTVEWHAVEGHQAMIGSLRSGAALGRFLAGLGIDPSNRDEIEAAALAIEREVATPANSRPAAAATDPSAAATGPWAGAASDPSPRPATDARAAAAYHSALDEMGARAAGILARIATVAGPARRLVVTGGWATGVAAQAVKRRHLGPYEHCAAVSTGARGAALAAGRAAGLWTSDDAPVSPPGDSSPAPGRAT